MTLDGGALGAAWALPFAGLLLSIAAMPLVVDTRNALKGKTGSHIWRL